MNKKQIIILGISISLIIASLIALQADLYYRNYDERHHLDTQVIDVEYNLLVYRPTYQYYDIQLDKVIITKGLWTLDLFQVIILITLSIGLFYILNRLLKKIDH